MFCHYNMYLVLHVHVMYTISLDNRPEEEEGEVKREEKGFNGG